MTLAAFQKRFGCEEACRAHLGAVRWPHGPICPACGVVRRAGRLRRNPPFLQCRDCDHPFSVTSGAALHGTKVPLSKWFTAIYLISSSSKGIAALRLADLLGVSTKTAWFMGHRIRAMMAGRDRLLTGIVDADEACLGGRKKPEEPHDPAASKRGRGRGRATMFVAVERGGEARAGLIASHTKEAIGGALRASVDPGARLISDGLPAYLGPGRGFAAHDTLDHGRRRFAEGDAHVNTAEAFFGLFRRAVNGVWHHISRKHANRYLHEMEWRWNRRKVVAAERVDAILSAFAPPLGWTALTKRAA